jgi:hypothetical protein
MRFAVLTDYQEQVKYIQPIMREQGSDIPAEGNGVVFAQFDENGELVAFQILQQAVFAEGMWAKDGRAHLRTLGNMVIDFLKSKGAAGRDLLTVLRCDEQGRRIGRFVRYMGFEELDCKLYRRKI